MISLRADFSSRVQEIYSFIDLTKIHENAMGPNDANIEGFKAMKAATHLLIYNLVESTATSIHELIFDTVSQTGTSFDDLIDPIRKTVMRNARRPNVDDLVAKLKVVSIDIISETFDREEIFSGNVDARKLRESFKSLGMSEPKAKGKLANVGALSLVTIKANRNDLSHGRKSFAEIGRDMTTKDLRDEMDGVVAFLDQCVKIAESFVQSSGFKV